MQEPQHKAPVIVAGKDVGEVDNDYLLIPVNILDHEGPLSATFPIENRLLPQGQPYIIYILIGLGQGSTYLITLNISICTS